MQEADIMSENHNFSNQIFQVVKKENLIFDLISISEDAASEV